MMSALKDQIFSSQDSDLLVSLSEKGLLQVRLNRPAKKNALSARLYRALGAALDFAAREDGIQAVLIGAEGPDFCAGNDILDFIQTQSGAPEGELVDLPVFAFLKTLTYFPKPLIAAVQGKAVGIGTTMLLHCDLVLAAEDVRLSLPFARLGLSPEAGSSCLLPSRIGHVRAFEALSLGAPLSSQEALSLGLINRVVPTESVWRAACELAESLATLSPSSLKATKALMRDPDAIWAQIMTEADVFRRQLLSPEARAAFMAFVNRG